jgi:hypothetical protein
LRGLFLLFPTECEGAVSDIPILFHAMHGEYIAMIGPHICRAIPADEL